MQSQLALANNIISIKGNHVSLLNSNANGLLPAAITTQLEFSVWDERFFLVDILFQMWRLYSKNNSDLKLQRKDVQLQQDKHAVSQRQVPVGDTLQKRKWRQICIYS